MENGKYMYELGMPQLVKLPDEDARPNLDKRRERKSETTL